MMVSFYESYNFLIVVYVDVCEFVVV